MRRPLLWIALVLLAAGGLALAIRGVDRRARAVTSESTAATAGPGQVELATRATAARDAPVATPEPNARARRAEEPRVEGLVAGNLWRSDGVTPAAHAFVGLYRVAEIDDSEASAFSSTRGDGSEASRRCRTLLRWSASDTSGAYRFEYVDPGAYVARAEQGPMLSTMSAPFRLGSGEARGALDLRFPPQGSLVGRVLAPDDASCAGFEIEITRVDPPAAPYEWRQGGLEDFVSEPLTGVGEFQVAPLQAGRHRAWLSFRGALGRAFAFAATSPGVYLGEVEIEEGPETRHAFDLRAGFPGALSIEVRLTADARPRQLPSGRVLEPSVRVVPDSEAPGTSALSVECEAGRARLGPLAPGLWSVFVTSPTHQWIHACPAKAVVLAGRTTELVVEIPIVRRRLACLDLATRKPLVGTLVLVSFGQGEHRAASGWRTDERGEVEIALPAGSYGIHAMESRPDEDVEGPEIALEWPPMSRDATTILLGMPR